MQFKLSKTLIGIYAATLGLAAGSTTALANDVDLELFTELPQDEVTNDILSIESRILGDSINIDDLISGSDELGFEDFNITDIAEDPNFNANLEDINIDSVDGVDINRSNVFSLSKRQKNSLRNKILKKNNVQTDSEDELIFLNSLPVGTKLIFNKNFVVQPKVNRIIIQNGIEILEDPDIMAKPSSYCRIDLVNSGRARVIKEGTEFIVVKNQSNVKKISNIKFENGPMKIQQQTIWVNNDNIRNISCYSSSNLSDEKLPIMIYDLYKETDRNITVMFPAFEEI